MTVMKNKKPLKHNKIEVKRSKTHGYGVFASTKVSKGTVLEECYFIVSRRGGDKALEDYYFDIDSKYGVLTGFGLIYNHSDDPNADYHFNRKTHLATIIADRTIQKGEEIFISYGDKWFSDRGLKAK